VFRKEYSATRAHIYFNRFASSRIPANTCCVLAKLVKIRTFAGALYLSTLEEEEEDEGEEEKVDQ
jgi:hypothetical protein